MLNTGDRVIIGVSGGPDSMALLFALRELQKHYKLSLWAAHYDHGLRGNESKQDADFVRTQVEQIGIPLVEEQDDGFLQKTKSNREEFARKKRYEFFQRQAFKLKAQKIALGHTANDQAETFFLWLFRGAGTRGLGGIPPVRDNLIIRPLIEIERKEILEFLKNKGIPWREDSSNLRTDYLRNQIRQSLMPRLLEECGPTLIKRISGTTKIFRDDDNYLASQSVKNFNKIIKYRDKNKVLLDIQKLTKFPLALKRRIIRCAIETINGSLRKISFDHIEGVLKIIDSEHPQLSVNLPYGLTVYKEYTTLRITRKTSNKINFYHEYDFLPDRIDISEAGTTLIIKVIPWNKRSSPLTNRDTALIDRDKVKFPLIVRNWRAGDRFKPLGSRGLKKIKDFFIDIKIPQEERQKIPLVFFGDCVAWIAGQRIDDRVKVSDETLNVIKMVIIQ